MSKPFLSVVMPRQLPRLALAVATALAGLALTGTHAVAQGPGAAFGTCATQQCPNADVVMAVALCWTVAGLAFAGSISLRMPGPRQASPTVLACVLLAAFAAVGAGIWVVVGSNTPLTVSVPSITGASTRPIQFS